jgi:glucokinase
MHAGDLLVCDAGGTHVRFAAARSSDGKILIESIQKLKDDNFGSFDDALKQYLASTGLRPKSACIAVAGPVRNGEVQMTNRSWHIVASDISHQFAIANVVLINDFVAMARAAVELEAEGFETIIEGVGIPGAPVLVAGPGTGFGVATLVPDAAVGWRVLSGEGGHMAFAPRDAVELELAKILRARHGYVPSELVTSGNGLADVHSAFCEMYGRVYIEMPPAEMYRLANEGDAMYRALAQVRANAVMGAVGDLVLVNGALGGAIIAGGVAERTAGYLKSAEACQRFAERGEFSEYLRGCPVRLMRNPDAPLFGAAAYYEQEVRR